MPEYLRRYLPRVEGGFAIVRLDSQDDYGFGVGSKTEYSGVLLALNDRIPYRGTRWQSSYEFSNLSSLIPL